jgi:hypothetical protein
VRIRVRHAFLNEEPTGQFSTCSSPEIVGFGVLDSEVTYDEAFVGPGDLVEVTGMLVREPDPSGSSVPGRGVPFVTALQGTHDRPLIVRRVRA